MGVDHTTIAIFGVGNMGEAVLAGFLRAGIPAQQIYIYDHDETRVSQIAEKYSVAAPSSLSALRDVDLCVIAVKPKDVAELKTQLQPVLRDDALVVSVAAGLSTDDIASGLAPTQRVVRVMPNTPAAIGAGVSAISAGAYATAGDVELVEQMFRGCGSVVVIPESQQAAVGALSGSGPAYVFYLLDALAEAGVVNGLSRALSQQLAVDTVLGAAQLIRQTGEHPVLARERVTSPGGTTAQALAELDASGVRAAVIRAVNAAVAKTAQLAASAG